MSFKRPRAAFEDSTTSSPFISFGTALPSLDPDVRDDGSYVPIWKQEVTDERGRKRLHGAFTGGFSAGYFNTVGSREGWAPTTFKSSRAARAKAAPARPEDFMDDEDLKEAAEAQKVETASGFSGIGSTEEELGRRVRQVTLMDLLTPAVQDTMGAKLLKKMGWKEGQGVGPKVRRRAILSSEAAEDDGDTGETYLFAPANSALVTFDRKNDFRGLGYAGDDSSLQREQVPESASKGKKKAKGGFGVGVLNDDDDDEDPYEIRPKSAYNRVIGGEKPSKASKPAVAKKPARHVFMSKRAIKATTGLPQRKCHDGRLPLGGFTHSSEPIQSQDGLFPPPQIPADWKSARSNTPGTQRSQPTAIAEQKLDPGLRGRILGEAPLLGKSVFDYLTPAARDKIASVTGNKNLPPALAEAPPSLYSSASSSLAHLVPKLDKAQALATLKGGFMPYADDPEKRLRYRVFLEIQAGLRSGLPDRKYGTSTQDWVKEMSEFMGAARIFKPLTGLIATRFTSATTSSTNFQGNSDLSSDKDMTVLLHRPQDKPEDPAQAAARMSMYGPMTRSVVDFFPSRLLCKRFNVPLPTIGSNGGEAAGGRQPPLPELVSKAQMTEMMKEAKGDESYRLPEMAKAPKVDTERNEALEGERAGEEVFKAIFGDGEDDDDEV